MIMRLTVRPKVKAVCMGGGGAGPIVPMQPMQPMNMSILVPTTSARNIVEVPFSIFHGSTVYYTEKRREWSFCTIFASFELHDLRFLMAALIFHEKQLLIIIIRANEPESLVYYRLHNGNKSIWQVTFYASWSLYNKTIIRMVLLGVIKNKGKNCHRALSSRGAATVDRYLFSSYYSNIFRPIAVGYDSKSVCAMRIFSRQSRYRLQ